MTLIDTAKMAFAWLMARDGVIAIPKAGTVGHVLKKLAVANFALSPEMTTRLEVMFPLPSGPVPLAMLQIRELPTECLVPAGEVVKPSDENWVEPDVS